MRSIQWQLFTKLTKENQSASRESINNKLRENFERCEYWCHTFFLERKNSFIISSLFFFFRVSLWNHRMHQRRGIDTNCLIPVSDTPSFAITRLPGFGIPIVEGMSVSLKCEVDSNPASTPIWQRGKWQAKKKMRFRARRFILFLNQAQKNV